MHRDVAAIPGLGTVDTTVIEELAQLSERELVILRRRRSNHQDMRREVLGACRLRGLPLPEGLLYAGRSLPVYVAGGLGLSDRLPRLRERL